MKNTILIVEDDVPILELIEMNLQAAGYVTVSAQDGLAAEKLLRDGIGADLALVDIMLPGKDGFALMDDLKKSDIPVIFLTAKGDVLSKVKGLRLGAEDYMVKPFEVLELLVRIEKVLERTGRAKKILQFQDIEVNLNDPKLFSKETLPLWENQNQEEMDIKINKVKLGYLRVRENVNQDKTEDILIPVWDFFGTWSGMDLDNISLLTLDARDGTVVKRTFGCIVLKFNVS